jgi:hypothetical protein
MGARASFGIRRSQSTEIDDPSDSIGSSTVGEHGGDSALLALKLIPPLQRVQEVVRNINAVEGGSHGGGVTGIARDHLDAVEPGPVP